MSNAEDEHFCFQDGEDHAIVANAILPQPGELAVQNRTRIGLSRQLLLDPGKNATRVGFVQPAQIARDRFLVGDEKWAARVLAGVLPDSRRWRIAARSACGVGLAWNESSPWPKAPPLQWGGVQRCRNLLAAQPWLSQNDPRFTQKGVALPSPRRFNEGLPQRFPPRPNPTQSP